MGRSMILLITTLMVFVAPGIRGTAHLSFDNTAEANITRAGCGVTKLCVETPDDCDPAGNSTCLFASFNTSTPAPPNGVDLYVQLSGNSTGYIALGLAPNVSEGTTMLFICAQDNGTFFFRTMTRNNSDNMLSPNEQIVTGIRSRVNGDLIQCEFNVPGVNATSTRTNHVTTFDVLLGSGTVNGTIIGNFMVTLTANSLNLADPGNNITTTPVPTTMTTNAASYSVHPHAVQLLLSVLTLVILKTA